VISVVAGTPSAELLTTIYRTMSLIRRFEERLKWLVETGAPVGAVHYYIGQEAVASGVCAALQPQDWISSTHRGHGHCIAKGVDVRAMMAELLGKATGTNRGKGGSMHITDIRRRVLGVNPIVGAGVAHALGAALSARVRNADEVAVAFFGEGAAGIGILHETMNMAAIWKLPVVFVCENNGYAQATPVEYALSSPRVADRAVAYNMPGMTVDGQDAVAVWRAADTAVRRARGGEGPSLVECTTYRYFGHHQGDDPLRYRTAEEERTARARDCLAGFRSVMARGGPLTIEQLDAIDGENDRLIDEAVEFATTSPVPHLEELQTDVYSPSSVPSPAPAGSPTQELNFGQAINSALRQEMRRDPSVIVIGEDVAGAAGRAHLGLMDAWGGPLRATRGLIQEFGPGRVIDTPIAEMGFVGAAVGAAMAGLRPVVEVMFADLIGVCYDQIVNQAAKMRYMMGGRIQLPLVIRTAYGTRGDKRSYGGGAAAQHSQTLYAVLAHIPGLKVVVPSTAYNAKGLTAAAIRDEGPVIVMEHKFLGLHAKGPVPDDLYTLPIGRADVVRRGADLTLVGAGRTTHVCLESASRLAGEGIDAEVIDLLTLNPMDEATIFESVARTHRLIVVDEDTPVCSIARDIAARVAEKAFDHLDAPIRTLTAVDAPVPFAAVLEAFYAPRVEDVVAAAHEILG
jgi:pyruvate/2-oxoglutarate/acetoin dehydrogenase E1 component/TPP-dependent pyruvate/acetoin dehydrogenase alpha subunit